MIYLENTTDAQELYIPRQKTINVTQTGIDLSNYLTSGETIELVDKTVDDKIAEGGFTTEEWVESQGYLKEHQSLEGYATEEWVENKHYLTEHQSLSAYSTTEQVEEKINAAIEAETARTESTYLKEHQSLDNYYTKTQVDDLIDNIDVSDQIDPIKDDIRALKAKDEELTTSLANKADKSEIPSLDGYATEEWVENKHYLTEHQSLADYSTTQQMNAAIDAAIAAETARTEATYIKEHQSLSAYSTTEQVENMIDEAISGVTVDLSDYYTSAQTDTHIQSAVTPIINRIETSEEVISTSLNDLDSRKADRSEIPDIAPLIERIETTEEVVATGLDDLDERKADKTEVSDLTNSVTSIEERIETSEEVISTSLNDLDSRKADRSEIPDIAPIIERADISEEVIATALDDLDNRKADKTEIPDTSNFVTSAYVQTQVSTKQDTLVSGTNIKTINNQSILGEGNIEIQGGGGTGSERVVELTKAEYEALSGYAENTTYVITDAPSVDLNDFAIESAVTSALTVINDSLDTKATKANTTARSGSYFPYWNAEGIITGSTQAYQRSHNVNGSTYNLYSNSSGNMPTVYAPTTAGTKGQPVLSNGSGAPVWGTYKFEFISQSAYDALATKDATTIYFIISEE